MLNWPHVQGPAKCSFVSVRRDERRAWSRSAAIEPSLLHSSTAEIFFLLLLQFFRESDKLGNAFKTALFALDQSDQMISWKSRPKCSPTKYLSKLINNCFRGKTGPKICLTSVIFKTLPKVNNRPIGEYLPNLVTLALVDIATTEILGATQ
jgi:hypothetical protein